jgi:hypothetical protein
VSSSGLDGVALCINILGQKHKENGEAKHAGIEMDPDYPALWWYKNLTDVQPAEARIPSWWLAAGSNCQKHPKEEISGYCLFNAKGSKLKEEIVKVSGANAQRSLCKTKLKATSQAEYFGLWACKDPETIHLAVGIGGMGISMNNIPFDLLKNKHRQWLGNSLYIL